MSTRNTTVREYVKSVWWVGIRAVCGGKDCGTAELWACTGRPRVTAHHKVNYTRLLHVQSMSYFGQNKSQKKQNGTNNPRYKQSMLGARYKWYKWSSCGTDSPWYSQWCKKVLYFCQWYRKSCSLYIGMCEMDGMKWRKLISKNSVTITDFLCKYLKKQWRCARCCANS